MSVGTLVRRTTPARLRESFLRIHGEEPRIFAAPGRVNLIGEHTDYNDGFVMPAAIGFHAWAAITPRRDGKLNIRSEQFGETLEFAPDELCQPSRRHWSDYVRGVAAIIHAGGYAFSGANIIVSGEVPLGSGLSSSAAIEVATALAILSIAGAKLSGIEIARLCQRAEHEYTGTLCGIMDQFISMHGSADHALILDCRSLDYKLLPLSEDVRVVICNTTVKHELATGEYNVRRADCQTAVSALSRHFPGITALRDVSSNDVERYRSEMSDVTYRRALHVVTENERVVRAAAALQSGDLAQFGKLMYESHASLREDYQVSCDELDVLVEAALNIFGVYGARMTGGGFGGCTVNLVKAEAVPHFQTTVARVYKERTGMTCPIYVCSAADGAGPVDVKD